MRASDQTGPGGDRGQRLLRALLVAGLLGLGLYILSGFLRALVWALVLAIALWPLFNRVRRRFPPGRHNILWPAVFTGLVALVLLLPCIFELPAGAMPARLHGEGQPVFASGSQARDRARCGPHRHSPEPGQPLGPEPAFAR